MNLKINRAAILNDVFIPYLDDQTDIQIYYGGTRSGKSVFLSDRLVLDIVRYDRNFLVVRNTFNSIRQSCFNEVKKSIAKFQLSQYFKVNESDLIITYIPQQRQVFFRGLDDPEKLKSIIPQKGTITDLWFEEATEITYNNFADVTVRMGGRSSVRKRTVLSFNPILRTHWIYKTFFEGHNPAIGEPLRLRDGRVLILRTNYTCNKFLSQQDVENIEDTKNRDKYRWEVYGLGEWGTLGGTIFNNWRAADLSGVEFDTYYNGLDFGFTAPTALVRCAIRGDNIYIVDGIYQTEITNQQLARVIKPIVNDEAVFCDCEDAKSWRELRTVAGYNINAHPVSKGKDSKRHGIMWLRNFKEIIISDKLQWFVDEIAAYSWQTNKYGDVLPEPIEKNDHGIDALRYACERNMRQYKPLMVKAGDESAGDEKSFGLLEKIIMANQR